MKKQVIYEVVVSKVGRGQYELKSCSDEKVFDRLAVNPKYDESICADIGWTLNKECDMVRVSDSSYSVRCYEIC